MLDDAHQGDCRGYDGSVLARVSRAAAVRAFTLIELMIVVAVVGILAVLAAYGVRKYMANAKSAEASNSVGRMAQDAAFAFDSGRSHAPSSARPAFCGTASASVPANVSAVAGRKYQSTPSEWNVDAVANQGFACLMFQMDTPQYYRYTYVATVTGNVGDSFTATANGDLDGDGNLSTFQLSGVIAPGMAANVAPNLIVVDGEE